MARNSRISRSVFRRHVSALWAWTWAYWYTAGTEIQSLRSRPRVDRAWAAAAALAGFLSAIKLILVGCWDCSLIRTIHSGIVRPVRSRPAGERQRSPF